MTDTELIDAINKCAYEVRLHLGPCFLESVYQNALLYELSANGLVAKKEIAIPVYYKNTLVGDYRADIIVENRIILEIKAVQSILPQHEVQLVNYLTATGLDCGILINYGGEKFAFRVKTRKYNHI